MKPIISPSILYKIKPVISLSRKKKKKEKRKKKKKDNDTQKFHSILHNN